MGKINIRQIIKEELDIALDEMANSNNLIKKLENIELVNPVHLKMVKSGGGEFPDTYKLTDSGIKLFNNILKESPDLNEMARAKVIYSVTDKPSLEKVIDAVKGNTKLALQYLLDKGEMAVADLAKELKKDPASFNNPGFRKLMSDLSDKNIISVGSVGTPSTPSAPKAEKPSPKVDMTTGDGEVDFEKEIPSDIDVMAGEKEFGDTTADTLGTEEKAKFEKLNTAIRSKVAKLEKMSSKDRAGSPDLAVVKQIINKPEVKKLFRSKGIDVMDLVSSVIG
jgi:hypothetical protein